MIYLDDLRGFSREKAILFGMPHLGCEYTDMSGSYHAVQPFCAICGRPAASCHHVVPLSWARTVGIRVGNKVHVLRSPLFALCGSGTTGCHNGFHGGAFLKARWEWDDVESEKAWESGELVELYGAHSPKLFDHGKWIIENAATGAAMERRGHGR